MKKKNLWIIALVAIITIGIIACKEDEPDTSCKCANGTEHLFGQSCCEGTGCNCKVYYGVLPNGIKIYKGEGVTDEQMGNATSGAVKKFNDAYELLVPVEKPKFDAAVKKLFVLSSGTYTWKDGVLGANAFDFDTAAITGLFEMVGQGLIAETQ